MARSDRDSEAAARQIGLRESLAGLLRQTRRRISCLLTSRGEVLGEIHPPSAAMRPRREPDALRGKIAMTDDFDVLPHDILTAMENGERWVAAPAPTRMIQRS